MLLSEIVAAGEAVRAVGAALGRPSRNSTSASSATSPASCMSTSSAAAPTTPAGPARSGATAWRRPTIQRRSSGRRRRLAWPSLTSPSLVPPQLHQRGRRAFPQLAGPHPRGIGVQADHHRRLPGRGVEGDGERGRAAGRSGRSGRCRRASTGGAGRARPPRRRPGRPAVDQLEGIDRRSPQSRPASRGRRADLAAPPRRRRTSGCARRRRCPGRAAPAPAPAPAPRSQ